MPSKQLEHDLHSGWIELKFPKDVFRKHFAILRGRSLELFKSEEASAPEHFHMEEVLSLRKVQKVSLITKAALNSLFRNNKKSPYIAILNGPGSAWNEVKLRAEGNRVWYLFIHSLAMLEVPIDVHHTPDQFDILTSIIQDFRNPSTSPSPSRDKESSEHYLSMKPFPGSKPRFKKSSSFPEEFKPPEYSDTPVRPPILQAVSEDSKLQKPFQNLEINDSNYVSMDSNNQNPTVTKFSEESSAARENSISSAPPPPSIQSSSVPQRVPPGRDSLPPENQESIYQNVVPGSAKPWLVEEVLDRKVGEEILVNNEKFGNLLVRRRRTEHADDPWCYVVSIRHQNQSQSFFHLRVRKEESGDEREFFIDQHKTHPKLESLESVVAYMEQTSNGLCKRLSNT